MGKRIRLWFHPSTANGDYVSAGGWGIDEAHSQIAVAYKNTEVHLTFEKDAIKVTTWSVKPNGELGGKIGKTSKIKYSRNKNKPDCPMEAYQTQIDVQRLERANMKADMRHCVVFKVGEKKSKKKR